MNKMPVNHTSSIRHAHRQIMRLLVVASLLCLLALASVVSSLPAQANTDSGPGGDVSNPTVRAIDVALPAVVRIITTIGGHLTVQFSTGNVTFPQNSSAYPLELSGTGTFISAHGDILTADHVINPPRDQSLDQFLEQTAAPDVANYINQHAKSGSQTVTADQVTQELQSNQLASTAAYDPATSQVFLDTAFTGPLSAPDISSLPQQDFASVDRIEMQSSFQNEDVAIIHVPMSDMPSVQLGDSSNVSPTDQLTIIGFPGNGDVSNKPTDLFTASVNEITVSSIKTTDTGAPVIQVGGNVEHGDSGGPALDSTGQVVGIVSFGLSADGTPGGTSFLQASNSASQLVQSLKLNTSPGPLQQAWNAAFNDYSSTAQGHWHRAAQEFAQLAAKYPQFKGLQPYLTYAQAQAKTEKTSTTQGTTSRSGSSSIAAYVWTIVGILVLAALLALLFGVFVWSRRRQQQRKLSASDASARRPVIAANGAPSPHQASAKASAAPPAATNQARSNAAFDDGLTAFGAPQSPQSAPLSIVSGTLRPWPCGHLNRPNARYCSTCGEPAPEPPTVRKFEQ